MGTQPCALSRANFYLPASQFWLAIDNQRANILANVYHRVFCMHMSILLFHNTLLSSVFQEWLLTLLHSFAFCTVSGAKCKKKIFTRTDEKQLQAAGISKPLFGTPRYGKCEMKRVLRSGVR